MKFCMIGSRGHFRYVFESIGEVPELSLTAVSSGCGDSPETLLKTARDAGFDPVLYSDWRKMLDNEKPDAVSIDGPFEKHAEMCVEALSRGIHVFCEKPIATTLDDFRRITDACARSSARIVSMVGLRYDPAFYQAAAMVRSGAIGKVRIIRAQKSYKLGTRPEFYRRRATYGGTIPWIGSHAFDWIMHFTGETFRSVSACQSAEDNGGNGELEIVAQCQLVTRSGILASVSLDYLRPQSAPSHGDDRVRAAGTKGVIEVRDGKIHLIDADGERVIEPETPDRRLFSDFILELLGKRPSIVSDEATLELTRTCLLAQMAADTGKTIEM